MHPHLWDSMQFLYMKDNVSYEEFLAAVYEAENERTEGKVVNMKAKFVQISHSVVAIVEVVFLWNRTVDSL